MSDLPWFKFYTEALSDPKFSVVANDNNMQPWEVLGIWTALLCIASNSPIRGTLAVSDMRGLGIKNLKTIIKWDDNFWDNTEFQDEWNFERVIQSFIELDMILLDEYGSYKIKNFEERQETKDEREKRLNRERQKRYQDSHKDDESVINNVINNGNLTQNSISISNSNSLIKELNVKNSKIPEEGDVYRVFVEVTGMVSIPASDKRGEYVEAIYQMLQSYGYDDTKRRMKSAYNTWLQQHTKNGRQYSKTNLAWINFAVADETLGDQSGDELNRLQELQDKKSKEIALRNQYIG